MRSDNILENNCVTNINWSLIFVLSLSLSNRQNKPRYQHVISNSRKIDGALSISLALSHCLTGERACEIESLLWHRNRANTAHLLLLFGHMEGDSPLFTHYLILRACESAQLKAKTANGILFSLAISLWDWWDSVWNGESASQIVRSSLIVCIGTQQRVRFLLFSKRASTSLPHTFLLPPFHYLCTRSLIVDLSFCLLSLAAKGLMIILLYDFFNISALHFAICSLIFDLSSCLWLTRTRHLKASFHQSIIIWSLFLIFDLSSPCFARICAL